MHTPELRLNKDQERRLVAGHCWIYSNEVNTQATPLKAFEPGQAVQIVGHSGRWLGHGYVNPHSLICARLVSRDQAHPLSPSLWVRRIHTALELRERLYTSPFYRGRCSHEQLSYDTNHLSSSSRMKKGRREEGGQILYFVQNTRPLTCALFPPFPRRQPTPGLLS